MSPDPIKNAFKGKKIVQEVERIEIQQGLWHLACDIVETQIPATVKSRTRGKGVIK